MGSIAETLLMGIGKQRTSLEARLADRAADAKALELEIVQVEALELAVQAVEPELPVALLAEPVGSALVAARGRARCRPLVAEIAWVTGAYHRVVVEVHSVAAELAAAQPVPRVAGEAIAWEAVGLAAAAEAAAAAAGGAAEVDGGDKQTIDERKTNEIKIRSDDFIENLFDRFCDPHFRSRAAYIVRSATDETRCSDWFAASTKAIRHAETGSR
jgi:hypothetical protein